MAIELPSSVMNIPFLLIFIAFAVGTTQMVKDEYDIESRMTIRLMAAILLMGSAVGYTFIAEFWRPYYILALLSIGTPGVIGLMKEIKAEGSSSVNIEKATNVDMKVAEVKPTEV